VCEPLVAWLLMLCCTQPFQVCNTQPLIPLLLQCSPCECLLQGRDWDSVRKPLRVGNAELLFCYPMSGAFRTSGLKAVLGLTLSPHIMFVGAATGTAIEGVNITRVTGMMADPTKWCSWGVPVVPVAFRPWSRWGPWRQRAACGGARSSLASSSAWPPPSLSASPPPGRGPRPATPGARGRAPRQRLPPAAAGAAPTVGGMSSAPEAENGGQIPAVSGSVGWRAPTWCGMLFALCS